MKERRLYVVSDTHTELRTDNSSNAINIHPLVDEGKELRNFLALCGDIGNPFDAKYVDFIRRHSERFERVFVVSGNHEYYSKKKGRTMKQIEEEMKRVCGSYNNVHFLQCETFCIDDDIVVAGCTLWTPVTKEAETWMRDFESIYVDEGKRICSYDILEKNGEMVEWLETTLKLTGLNTKKKVIVLTHHSPSKNMLLCEEETKLSSRHLEERMYCSPCENMFQPPLILWLSGHTHHSLKIEINGIVSASNCWGYPGQSVKHESNCFFLF